MPIRRAMLFLVVLATVLAWTSACSDTTKYRVLNFFLDGVPDPNASTAMAKASDESPDGEVSPDRASAKRATGPPAYSHTPFRLGHCGGCHNPTTGDLFKPLGQGLCGMCHTDVPGDARFVHGPVAVDACDTCHHPHTAPYPSNLLTDPKTLCIECHEPEDLTQGEHHVPPNGGACLACHNPHGGSDRYFLERSDP